MSTKSKVKAVATATATATGKTGATAVATLVVIPALRAAVKIVATAGEAMSKAEKAVNRSWIDTAKVLSANYKTREEAAPYLKQAFEDAKLTLAMHGSYRSNILALAYAETPALAASRDQAIADGLDTNKVLAAVRGGLKKGKGKNGQWVKVERQENRGGSNKIKPLDKIDADFALIATHAQTSKVDEEQLAVIVVKHLEAADFDIAAFAKAVIRNATA